MEVNKKEKVKCYKKSLYFKNMICVLSTLKGIIRPSAGGDHSSPQNLAEKASQLNHQNFGIEFWMFPYKTCLGIHCWLRQGTTDDKQCAIDLLASTTLNLLSTSYLLNAYSDWPYVGDFAWACLSGSIIRTIIAIVFVVCFCIWKQRLLF